MRNRQTHGPFRLTLNVSDRVILDNYVFIHVHDSPFERSSPFSLINARAGGVGGVGGDARKLRRENFPARKKEERALRVITYYPGIYLCEERKNET